MYLPITLPIVKYCKTSEGNLAKKLCVDHPTIFTLNNYKLTHTNYPIYLTYDQKHNIKLLQYKHKHALVHRYIYVPTVTYNIIRTYTLRERK